MNKLISYLAIITLFFTIACSPNMHPKWKPLTKRELKEHGALLDSIIAYNKAIDSINSIYNLDTILMTSGFTVDTGRITSSTSFYWEPKMDTSDVIVQYVFNWEEGEIETVTGKIVYPKLNYGMYYSSIEGASIYNSKFFKVSNGVWIPVEWPKDIVNIYIRPKE